MLRDYEERISEPVVEKNGGMTCYQKGGERFSGE